MADKSMGGYCSESDESFCDTKMAPGEEQQLPKNIDSPDWLELALPTEKTHVQSLERLEGAFVNQCSFCGKHICEQGNSCTNNPDRDPWTVDFVSDFNNVVSNSLIQTVDFLSTFDSATSMSRDSHHMHAETLKVYVSPLRKNNSKFHTVYRLLRGGQLRGDDRPLPLGLCRQRSGPSSKGMNIIETGVGEDGQSSKHPQPPGKD